MRDTSSFKSFVLGLMLPPLAAIPCLFAACPDLKNEVAAAELVTAISFWFSLWGIDVQSVVVARWFLSVVALGAVITMAALLVALSWKTRISLSAYSAIVENPFAGTNLIVLILLLLVFVVSGFVAISSTPPPQKGLSARGA